MSRIYVEFSKLNQLGTDCKKVSLKIDTIQSELMNTVNHLDWEVRYQSEINNTAKRIVRKMEKYSTALNSYQTFLNNASLEYRKLDSYSQKSKQNSSSSVNTATVSSEDFYSDFISKFGPVALLKNFGNVGKIVGLIDSASSATSWTDWAKFGISASQVISAVSKDIKNYAKIGRAIGSKNAVSYFLKKQVGLRTVGHASTASNPISRFYNNLHNSTSSFNLSDAFSSLTGKKGAGKAVASWAGVALTGAVNAYSNIDEQKNSNGTMSNGRVVAETVTETAIDTIVTYAGSAVVGAAITAVTGTVAAPVVVAAATGLAVVGINAGVEALTGKSATEWVSDTVLDTAENIGKGISNGAKAVGKWFNKLSFT